MRKIKKTVVIAMVFMLVMSTALSSYAFADNRPSGGNMEGGPNGQQGMSQQGGAGMGQPNGQNTQGMNQGNSQMGKESPDNLNGVLGGNMNNMPNGNGIGMTNGNNQMRPDKNGMDIMAVEEYLKTDDADDNIKAAYDALKEALAGKPGEDNAEDIETLQNTLMSAIEAAGVELSDYENELSSKDIGINLMAVEAYLATDDADENVQSAYDALETALGEEPGDETDDNIAELESALETALEDADVNLDDYINEQPDAEPMNGQPGNGQNNEPYMGVNMKAVEAYLATDDADENVQSAYEALESALAENPEDGTDSGISDLETALESAIKSAGIDLNDYETTEAMPEDGPQRMEETQKNGENAENTGLTEQENNIIRAIWNKIVSLFK